MKKHLAFLAVASSAALVLAPRTALADVETHSVPYSYSIAENGDVYPHVILPGFKDHGGSRTLTGVDVRVQADVSATLAIENMTDAVLTDWELDGQHLVLVGMDRPDTGEFGPFAFMGGLFIEPFTSPLSAHDAVDGAGDDYYTFATSTTIDSTLDMDPSYLPFFSAGGEISTVLGPFTEFFLGGGATYYDPKSGTGDVTVNWTELGESGTLSVIYHYTEVPEPTSALTLACATLLIGRRRRR